MTLPYVYKLTDTVTGKWYIGSRTANGCYPEELGVRYFTSSRVVAPMYKADPARFKADIVVHSEDSDYIIKVESDMLKLRNARDDEMSYNMCNADAEINYVKVGKASGEFTRDNKLGIHGVSREKKLEFASIGGKIGGKVTGKKNAESGFLLSLLTKEVRDKAVENLHKVKDQSGRSQHAIKMGKLGSAKTNSILYRCECGVEFGVRGMMNHQRSSGHSRKERIK